MKLHKIACVANSVQMPNKALLSQPSAGGTACCAARSKAWRYVYSKTALVNR